MKNRSLICTSTSPQVRLMVVSIIIAMLSQSVTSAIKSIHADSAMMKRCSTIGWTERSSLRCFVFSAEKLGKLDSHASTVRKKCQKYAVTPAKPCVK